MIIIKGNDREGKPMKLLARGMPMLHLNTDSNAGYRLANKGSKGKQYRT